MRVRVRVFDGLEWSDFSAQTYFYIYPNIPSPSVESDSDFDQRMNPDDKPVLVLNRQAAITFDGTYQYEKQLSFPFDVYSADKTKFYSKDTWIDVSTLRSEYPLPTWIDEGSYTIKAKTCVYSICRDHEIDVSMVGRLYDFRIWDIGDLRYEEVFRQEEGSINHLPTAYFSGGRDENGKATTLYGQDKKRRNAYRS